MLRRNYNFVYYTANYYKHIKENDTNYNNNYNNIKKQECIWNQHNNVNNTFETEEKQRFLVHNLV